jgi:outer membrane protein assembly factor BamB
MVVFTREHEASGRDPSSWVAVDRKTGRTRWELARQTSIKTSYSTPCVYTPKGEAPQLIFTSLAHGVSGVDLRTGKVVWEVKRAFRWRVVASPVIADGLIVASCGRRAVVVRPGSEDPPAQPAVVRDKGPIPYCPTPLAKDGLLFVLRDDGRAYCLRAATGEQLWCQRPGGRFAGSPVWANGRLYWITMDGRVVVIRAAAKYELLAANPLGEASQATPAVAGERMYLRTWSHLISIGRGKRQTSGD